jgi:hypothetical protein
MICLGFISKIRNPNRAHSQEIRPVGLAKPPDTALDKGSRLPTTRHQKNSVLGKTNFILDGVR